MLWWTLLWWSAHEESLRCDWLTRWFEAVPAGSRHQVCLTLSLRFLAGDAVLNQLNSTRLKHAAYLMNVICKK